MVTEKPPFSIVVADDDSACRETLRDILLQRGFETFEAESGEEAIHIVESHSVDLGFLDYQMPDMTGLAVLRVIREINPVLQCVMVSGADEPSLLDWARTEGALSLLRKPVHLDMISSVLEIMISNALRERTFSVFNEDSDRHTP